MITANETICLEICRNTEWLRENAGLDLARIEEAHQNEAADELYSELCTRLRAIGFDVESAKRQRVTYHGWNGANSFRHKFGAVATFSDLSDTQQADIFAAIDAAVAAVQKQFAE